VWTTLWSLGSDRGGLAGHDDVPDERLPEVPHDNDNLLWCRVVCSRICSQANRRAWTAVDPLSVTWNPAPPG
jgi:hypothetical protein